MTAGLFIQGLITSSLPAGIIFFISGRLMQKYPPRWPNYWYGYRTMRSLRTKESFDAANTFSAALMVRYGILLMLAGLPLALFFRETYWWFFLGIGMLALVTCVVLLIVKTERYLAGLFP
jgi:uncharacterized membrane protein